MPVPAIYEFPVPVNLTHSSQSDIMNSLHTLCLRLFSIPYSTAQRNKYTYIYFLLSLFIIYDVCFCHKYRIIPLIFKF